jgi:hypothetical protein
MRDFSYSPPGSSKRYERSLVLTPRAGAFVPSSLVLADGTVWGSSSRFLVDMSCMLTWVREYELRRILVT